MGRSAERSIVCAGSCGSISTVPTRAPASLSTSTRSPRRRGRSPARKLYRWPVCWRLTAPIFGSAGAPSNGSISATIFLLTPHRVPGYRPPILRLHARIGVLPDRCVGSHSGVDTFDERIDLETISQAHQLRPRLGWKRDEVGLKQFVA